MAYDPDKDLTLKKLQREVHQLNRDLKLRFDPHKFDHLFVLHARIRERVLKQSKKLGQPVGWDKDNYS